MPEKITLFELDIDYDDILEGNASLLKTINTLKKAQKELAKETDNLTDATEDQSKEFVSNQNAIKSLTKEYNSNNKVLQALNNTSVESITTVEDARKALVDVGTVWARTTKLEGENSTSSKKLAARKLELTNRLKELESSTGDNTRSVGGYTEGIDKAAEGSGAFGKILGDLQNGIGSMANQIPGLNQGLAATTGGFKAVIAQMWAMVANPIGATIAALVLAFTALYKIFKSTDSGGTELEAQFAKLGAIVDVLKKRVVILIDAMKALFSGEFSEAADLFGKSVQGVGDDLDNATQSAYDYVIAMDAIKDREIAAISEQATLRKEIEKNITLSKDQSKSNDERVAALKKATELELQLSQQKQNFANEEYEEAVKIAASKTELSKEELDLFIKSGEKQQTYLRENNQYMRRAWETLKDEGIQSLEELYSKGIEAETEYYKKSKETTSQLSGLRNKLDAEDKKRVDDRRKAQVKDLELDLALFEQQNQAQISSGDKLTETLINQEADRLQKILLQEQAINQKKFDNGLISQKEYNLHKITLDNEYSANVVQLYSDLYEQQYAQLQTELEKEKEAKDNALLQEEAERKEREMIDAENKLALQEEHLAVELEYQRSLLDAKYQAEIEAANKVGADTNLIDEKYRKLNQKLDKQAFDARMQLAAGFLGNLATIFGKQSKAGKAAAAAAATVSAIQGAVSSYASLSGIPIVGPALGAVAAAAALASGYANVKKIYATKSGLPGDSGGGSAPSGGSGYSATSAAARSITQPIQDGGLLSRDSIDGTQEQIKNGVSAALKETPQQQVLVVDDVTAMQTEQTQIEMISEA